MIQRRGEGEHQHTRVAPSKVLGSSDTVAQKTVKDVLQSPLKLVLAREEGKVAVKLGQRGIKFHDQVHDVLCHA